MGRQAASHRSRDFALRGTTAELRPELSSAETKSQFNKAQLAACEGIRTGQLIDYRSKFDFTWLEARPKGTLLYNEVLYQASLNDACRELNLGGGQSRPS